MLSQSVSQSVIQCKFRVVILIKWWSSRCIRYTFAYLSTTDNSDNRGGPTFLRPHNKIICSFIRHFKGPRPSQQHTHASVVIIGKWSSTYSAAVLSLTLCCLCDSHDNYANLSCQQSKAKQLSSSSSLFAFCNLISPPFHPYRTVYRAFIAPILNCVFSFRILCQQHHSHPNHQPTKLTWVPINGELSRYNNIEYLHILRLFLV